LSEKQAGRKPVIVGYSRTSTADQTAGLAAQERDLHAAGAEKLFSEQVSSVAERRVLAECLGFLRRGDVLMVTRPDRLARSTSELLTIEADLSKRGVGLVVLSMGGERLEHPQSDIQADADHPGRRGDLGARDHAGAPARGHRQGQGGGPIQGPAAQHRSD
jgi:predicted site-specific integrase-resolvase